MTTPKTWENALRIREDRSLVKRLLAGEEAAFEQFFEDNFDSLYRFAVKRLGCDEALAEEIAQATIVKAIEKIGTYRGEAALFSWLCTFCRFEVSAYHRKNKWTPARVDGNEETPEISAVLESIAAGAEGTEGALLRSEVADLVHETLDALPPRYGRALEWKYFDGRPVAEIAARLVLSAKAAESLLTRARDAFRRSFGQPSPLPSPPRGRS